MSKALIARVMRDSQRNFLNERQKTRDAKLREIQRQEQRADPSSLFNQYRHASEDARANRMADAENQRKLAEQALINEGQFAVEDRRQLGGTARTNLEQMAWNQRHGAELGFKYDDLGRQVTDADRTYDLEKFKAFTTPEAGGIPANPMQRAAQFEAMRELGNPNQNNMLQDNQGSGWVESADGTRFLTDPTGGISQQAAPSEVNLTPLPGYQSDPGRRDYSGINQSVIAPSRTTGPGESIAESSGLTRKLKKLKDYLWITPEQYNRR